MYDAVMPMAQHDLPQFTLRQQDLPEVKMMEVKQEKYLVMKVKMIGKRSREDLNSKVDKESVEGDFQVMSIKALGDKPVDAKSLEQKEFEEVVAKAKSGI